MRQNFAWMLGALASLSATAALADPGDGGWHPMMGWGGWFFGPIMMVLFFALLIAAVVIIARLLGGDRTDGGSKSTDRAVEILRERFARGEITKEEFDEARRTLEG